MQELRERKCRFIVFPRGDGDSPCPADYGDFDDLFCCPFPAFRNTQSSTALRAASKESSMLLPV